MRQHKSSRAASCKPGTGIESRNGIAGLSVLLAAVKADLWFRHQTRSSCNTMPDTTSRRVANWVLQEKIGRGSFAVVWKAIHAETGNCVAVKEISTDRLNKKLKQSLESEVSILKQIRHQNIVRLEDVVEVTSPASTFLRPTLLACLAACAFCISCSHHLALLEN